LLNKKLTLGSR